MENSIILIIDFFSRNSTVGEKEWKNSKKKKSSGVGGWRGGLRKKYDFCTHISSRWKMKVLLSPFIIFHAWNFAGFLLSSRQTEMKVGLTFYCLFVHGYSFSATARQAILLLQIKLFTEEDGWWKGTPFIWCLTSSLSSLFPPTSFRPNWALCTT